MNFDEFYKKVSQNIKYHRKLKNLSQECLAELANISTDYLGKIETGKNKPGIIALIKIINSLDISIKEFFSNFE